MARSEALVIQIRIAARPATVFKFFSDPTRFEAWMGKGNSLSPTCGGGLTIRYPNGDTAIGQVQEVIPDKRLVFTWGYRDSKHGLPAGASQVAIDLTPIETGTLVTLTHTGLDAQQRRDHGLGWRHALAALSVRSSGEQLQSLISQAVDTYLAAWRETDPEVRRALLQRCWHPRGVFLDPMGFAESIEALTDYIGVAQHFAPGIVLERASGIHSVHGCAVYGWRMVSPMGDTLGTGQNVCEFDADGRLIRVVGLPPATAL
jgi:uncharacterized protein YndB with AHSA1/START domain